MKFYNYYPKAIIILSILFTQIACSEDDGNATTTPTPNPLAIEGPIEGSWLTGSVADVGDLSTNTNALEFTVDSGANYSLIYHQKDNTTITYAGTVSKSKSTFNHTSGAAIWDIHVMVQTINGMSFPGGWRGIYSFDNENRLLLNIEPTVVNWPVHPTAAQGLGSGDSGLGSIYRFNRQ